MEQTFENLKIRGKYGESLFACCEIYYYYQNVQSFCVYMYVKISPWMWKYLHECENIKNIIVLFYSGSVFSQLIPPS